MKFQAYHFAGPVLVMVSMGLGAQLYRTCGSPPAAIVVNIDGPLAGRCDREHDLVKVTLETARALSRHGHDSEPYQYKAAGQMETMFRVCFADPDRDSPESPGLLAARLGDLTDDDLAYVEKVIDDGWRASQVGQPWRGGVR